MASFEEAVAMAVNVLAAVFGKTVTPAMLQGYAIGLEGLTPRQIEQATKHAITRCRFMPTPCELRELAGDAVDLEGQAALAWQTVLRSISQIGWYRSVDFEDKCINAAIRGLGGWQWLCELATGDRLPFFRADFIRLYQSHARVGVPDWLALPLAGEFERQNVLLGFHRTEDEPIQIGGETSSRRQLAADTTRDAEIDRMIGQLAKQMAIPSHEPTGRLGERRFN